MLLGVLFCIVATFYASVGFGGGSSYLALLVLWDLPYTAIPAIALICNILVVSGNSFHYVRAGYLNRKLLLPPVAASIPMAYLGGLLPVGRELFTLLLCVTLLLAGLRLLVSHRKYGEDEADYRTPSVPIGLSAGAVLGFVSGLVGIGGGIFLAPILYNMRAGTPKQIATTASLFILLNSVAGLAGQLQKNGVATEIVAYWYLPMLAFAGGQLGNLLTVKWIPSRTVALLTSLLVLFVAGRMGFLL